MSGTTRVSLHQKGKTRKVKPIWIYWSKREWVAVASAWPYAKLTWPQTDNHTSTPPLKFFTGRMPFLPPNQQRQSTEGKYKYKYTKDNLNVNMNMQMEKKHVHTTVIQTIVQIWLVYIYSKFKVYMGASSECTCMHCLSNHKCHWIKSRYLPTQHFASVGICFGISICLFVCHTRALYNNGYVSSKFFYSRLIAPSF